MKKIIIATFVSVISLGTFAQGILDKVKKQASKDSSGVLSGISKTIGGTNGSNLSNSEIISGLKEALKIGTDSSTARLSKVDGFFTNAAIKILMPDEAKKAEQTLRNLGMSSLVDKAILSMNRAAEDAASGVTEIFWDAIRNMTITDGLSILRGNDHAATDYLKKVTSASLQQKMAPVIKASLDKVNATTYWKDVFTAYNRVSRQQVNTDLTAYVTERAMNGIFYSVAEEEQKIRKDPKAQVTDLLKKVFSK